MLRRGDVHVWCKNSSRPVQAGRRRETRRWRYSRAISYQLSAISRQCACHCARCTAVELNASACPAVGQLLLAMTPVQHVKARTACPQTLSLTVRDMQHLHLLSLKTLRSL